MDLYFFKDLFEWVNMRGWVWGARSELVLGKLLPWVKTEGKIC